MNLPRSVLKKDGHTVRFDAAKLEQSLLKSAHHVHFDDHDALKRAYEDILVRISSLHLDPLPVHRIREQIIAVLKSHNLSPLLDAYDLTFLHLHSLRIQKIQKRSGEFQDFRPYSIFKSLTKAFRDAGIHNPYKAEQLTKEIIEQLEEEFAHRDTPKSTDVKRILEATLLRHGLNNVNDTYRAHRYL